MPPTDEIIEGLNFETAMTMQKTAAQVTAIPVKQLVDELSDQLQLNWIAGQSGWEREIREKDLNRPGLALAGFFGNFQSDRIQILGNTEIDYLRAMSADERSDRIGKVFAHPLPLVIISAGNPVPEEIKQAAELYGVPLTASPLTTTELSSLLVTALDERFAPTIRFHAGLVDIYGVGVLLTGKARIGKSELALDLVERGHRLVADDVVELSRRMTGVLIGRAPEMLRHLIEVRGLGIVDVEKMFGVRAVRFQKRVEVVLELVGDATEAQIERLGLDVETVNYLGIDLPLVKLPVLPGKYLTVLAETVALNLLLRLHGVSAAEQFSQRLNEQIERKRMLRKYLEGDFE